MDGAILTFAGLAIYAQFYADLKAFSALKKQRTSFKVVEAALESMEEMRAAIEEHPHGLIIRFDVAARSSRLEIPSGYNPWRRCIEAKLTEEPAEGRANRQLIGEVARIFGIPEREVEILNGHKSSRKILLARGMSIDRALASLKKDAIDAGCKE